MIFLISTSGIEPSPLGVQSEKPLCYAVYNLFCPKFETSYSAVDTELLDSAPDHYTMVVTE
jgi:hypothetical protein